MKIKLLLYFLPLFFTISYLGICLKNIKADDNDEIILETQENDTIMESKNNISINYNNKKIAPKPDNVPDFPKDDNIEYKKLFDDSFSNVVENEYMLADDNDVFIDPYTMRNLNKQKKSGNDNVITQIETIKAEKKTQTNNNNIDKNKVSQNRYRVVAFLTLDQMLLSDLFENNPDRYYIDFVKSKLMEKGKIASIR